MPLTEFPSNVLNLLFRAFLIILNLLFRALLRILNLLFRAIQEALNLLFRDFGVVIRSYYGHTILKGSDGMLKRKIYDTLVAWKIAAKVRRP